MLKFRTLVMFVVVAIAAVEGPILSETQSVPAAIQSASVLIHISLLKSSYAIGERPTAVMTIKNIGSNEIWFSTDPYLEHIHITNKDGEPQKTEYHRHLRGDFRPGDGPALRTGPVIGRSIVAGSQDSQKYDLAAFYDLSAPGDYSVFIEIYDPWGPKDGSGLWLRTNTAHFTIEAPSK